MLKDVKGGEGWMEKLTRWMEKLNQHSCFGTVPEGLQLFLVHENGTLPILFDMPRSGNYLHMDMANQRVAPSLRPQSLGRIHALELADAQNRSRLLSHCLLVTTRTSETKTNPGEPETHSVARK